MARTVTSVRVQTLGGHDYVRVWTRGAYSGELILSVGDGDQFARSLIGEECDTSDVPGTFAGMRTGDNGSYTVYRPRGEGVTTAHDDEQADLGEERADAEHSRG